MPSLSPTDQPTPVPTIQTCTDCCDGDCVVKMPYIGCYSTDYDNSAGCCSLGNTFTTIPLPGCCLPPIITVCGLSDNFLETNDDGEEVSQFIDDYDYYYYNRPTKKPTTKNPTLGPTSASERQRPVERTNNVATTVFSSGPPPSPCMECISSDAFSRKRRRDRERLLQEADTFLEKLQDTGDPYFDKVDEVVGLVGEGQYRCCVFCGVKGFTFKYD
mmetsp:Transcript_19613/g.22557  ORF Transcript_19613/g.22557 Transcript_19613/m.22557 type:complete len:216 (+) Transcript_19613:501-1148(+)